MCPKSGVRSSEVIMHHQGLPRIKCGWKVFCNSGIRLHTILDRLQITVRNSQNVQFLLKQLKRGVASTLSTLSLWRLQLTVELYYTDRCFYYFVHSMYTNTGGLNGEVSDSVSVSDLIFSYESFDHFVSTTHLWSLRSLPGPCDGRAR